MRELSSMLTKPSDDPNEPQPIHPYRLSGVGTDQDIMYLRRKHNLPNGHSSPEASAPEWQWWRISPREKDNAPVEEKQKDQEADKAATSQETSAFGAPTGSVQDWLGTGKKRTSETIQSSYVIRTVPESEVLEAVKSESKTAFLVYASEKALNHPTSELPKALAVSRILSSCCRTTGSNDCYAELRRPRQFLLPVRTRA